MWWHFFNTAKQVRIKKDFGRATSLLTMQVNWDLIQSLTSFQDPVLCCVSIGNVDLVPTIEEYIALLQVPSSPAQIYMPTQQYWACYPNINLRGGVIQVEANFFDLNAELKTIFNQQKQI